MAYKNKEDQIAYSNKYYQANKEKKAAQYQANKDGLYTVYLLPTHSYVGMTDNLPKRIAKHKSEHKREISNVQILGKYKTKREALDVEATYHSKGYLGRHPNYNKITI